MSGANVLLTAFGPFGGEKINPAEEAARRVKSENVTVLILPVEYKTAASLTVEAIDRLKPEIVISVGQAGGRTGITPERVGVNLRNASCADNAGVVCENEPIVPGGEERLLSSFDPDGIAEALTVAGFSAYVSDGAGTYVCNDVMYSVLYRLRGTAMKAGFIHVPFCTEQAAGHPGAFSMSVEDMARALDIAIETVRKTM